MKNLNKCIGLTIAGILFTTWNSLAFAQASPDDIWSTVSEGRVDEIVAESDAIINILPNVEPTEYHTFRLNPEALQEALSRAPLEMLEVDSEFRPEPVIIYLPTPTGEFSAFEVFESVIMEPELASKFPEIKTYSGVSRDDSSISVRFDSTPAGFHAQVLAPGQRWFVDPQFKDNSDIYLSYFSRSLPAGTKQCLLESEAGRGEISQSSARSGDVLRTYRLAVAATGEYTAFHGGTVASGLAAIVTTINRVVGIYEKEIAVRLILVGTSNNIVYTIPGSPFTGNDNANVLIDESQAVITSVIGTPNFDIGHTFSTGAGGLAGLGVACNATGKASGVTGQSNPVGDSYAVDFVAHELGHQLGGEHTFNGAVNFCSNENQRSGPSAYEPGSGSTIMGYAGDCGSDDLQENSDPIFHSESHRQIMELVTGLDATCGTTTALGNATPVANAGADYTIPAGTAFALTGTASDANSGDVLTHLWEERDLGSQSVLGAPDDGLIPLFRVYTPSTSPTRYLPRLSTLAIGEPDITEKIPSVFRFSNWRYTVRDQNGGVASDDMQLRIIDTIQPLQVISPDGGEIVSGSTTVTWDVAGTNGDLVSTPNVDIFLSVDGGLTYPTSLVIATPNDGSHTLVVPNSVTTTARIMIKGNNSVFFDVSNANFTITEGPPGVPTEVSPSGLFGSQTPDYTWTSVVSNPAASYYYLWIENENGVVYNRWYSAAEVGCPVAGLSTTCTINPGYPVGGNLSFYIQAYNRYSGLGGSYGPWSSGMSFTNGSPPNPGRPTRMALFASSAGIDSDYTWHFVANATWYQIWVQDDTGNYSYRWYTAAALGCTSPGFLCDTAGLPTPNTAGLTGNNRRWYVRGFNGASGNALYGLWSQHDSEISSYANDALLSKSDDGVLADKGVIATLSNRYPSISFDGRYTIYSSESTNLSDGDNNNAVDLFTHDIRSDTTLRISSSSQGASRTGSITKTEISGDGEYVVYASNAESFVSGEPNGTLSQIYVWNRTGRNTRSISNSYLDPETLSNGSSIGPVVDYSGRHIFFSSSSTDLTEDGNPQKTSLYHYDVALDTVSRIETLRGQVTFYSNASAAPLAVSRDGRYVVYALSIPTQRQELYRHDLNTGETIGLGDGTRVEGISDDGNVVLIGFYDGNGNRVKRYEIDSGSRQILSSLNGTGTPRGMSSDGRFSLFTSVPTGLVTINGIDSGIYLHDALSDELTGLAENFLDISGDGNVMTYVKTGGTAFNQLYSRGR